MQRTRNLVITFFLEIEQIDDTVMPSERASHAIMNAIHVIV